MRFTTILFDLDGTLVDSGPDIASGINHIRHKVGLPPYTTAEVRRFVGNGLHQLIRDTVALPGATGETFEEMVKLFSTYYNEHLLDETLLYPGVREMLAELTGRTLAVVTNKPRHWSMRILEQLGIADLFSAVIGGDSAPHKKPFPDPIEMALEQVGARADETLMVGDSYQDLEAASSAGVSACWVSWGFGSADLVERYRPDFVLHDAREFRAMLEW